MLQLSLQELRPSRALLRIFRCNVLLVDFEMSNLYTLEICEVHGLPSSCSWLMLEVIVRTPRLLNTIRRKHTTKPFQALAARGVNLTWEQARRSKAHVRLRLLSGAAAFETPMDATVAPSPVPAIHGGRGCKSAAAPLLLSEAGTEATAAIHLQLPAEVELDVNCSGGGESGGGNGDCALQHAAELHCIIRAANRGSASVGERTSTAAANSAVPTHAWTDAAPRTAQRASGALAPRKRSWLLAWGLGRNSGARHSSGGAVGATTDIPRGSALGASESAITGHVPRGVEGEPAMPGALPSPSSCSMTLNAASQPVASGAFSSGCTSAVAVDVGAASDFLGGGGGSRAGGSWRLKAPMAGRASAGCATLGGRAELPVSCAAGDSVLRLLQNTTLLGSGVACPSSATARMGSMASPFGPLAHTPSGGRRSTEGTQPTAAAFATTTISTPLTSTLATAHSGCSELQPQPGKRRRLGDFLSKLFIPSTFSMIRRVGTDSATVDTPPAAAAVSPFVAADCACSNTSRLAPGLVTTSQTGTEQTALLTAAMATSSTSGPGGTPSRRHGSPLGITLPSPRLGDVYRIQDNPLISDGAVQLGFAATAHNTAVIPDQPPGTAVPTSLRGLDSPGFGEGSPAAGPDRLMVEPPVEGMAAASLASPMASSPGPPPAGCLYWLYGARARAAQQTSAGAAVATDAGQQGGRKGRTGDGGCEGAAAGASGASPAECQKESQAREAAQRDPCSGAVGSRQDEGDAAGGAEAAGDCDSDSGSPLEAEITRVVAFITGQSGLSEELRAVSLSQCQFLLDCLRNPDTCWLVADNLLQLKHEVGFPFDTGVAIPGAPDWFRLVLQPAQHMAMSPPQHHQQQPAVVSASEAAVCGDGLQGRKDTGAANQASMPMVLSPLPLAEATARPPPPAPEVLKVRWARTDQRQAGGANACAAIALEVAAWCLLAVQRWRTALTAAASTAAGGNAHPRRRDVSVWPESQTPQPQPQAHHTNPVASDQSTAGNSGTITRRESITVQPPPLQSGSQRDRESTSVSVPMESMPADVLEGCIETGTEVWQAVLMQSPAARVASSTGDFDLEHMLQLGGYSQGLRMADYTAASLLRSSCGMAVMTSGGGGSTSGGGIDGGSLCRVSDRGYSCNRESKGGSMATCRVDSLAGGKKEQGGDEGTSTTVSHHGGGALEVRRSREAMLRSSGCLFVQRANSTTSGSLQQQQQLKDEQLKDEQQGGLMRPPQPLGAVSLDPSGARGGDGGEDGKVATVEPRSQRSQLQLLRTSQLGVSAFASVVRGLAQGVYVLGWHGHFATLWLRPGGVVHLIDSLGSRLAPDCPLAFILEFDRVEDFLSFFLARHRAGGAGASADDIAEGNMAALVEVHSMELQLPLLLKPQGQQGQGQQR